MFVCCLANLIDIEGNYVSTKTSFGLLRGWHGMGWSRITTHWLAPDYPKMVLGFGFFLFRPCFIIRYDCQCYPFPNSGCARFFRSHVDYVCNVSRGLRWLGATNRGAEIDPARKLDISKNKCSRFD